MINLVLNSLPQSLELKDIWNYHHFLILQSMHQSLVRIDDNGDIVGDLAASWNIKNQGKTYHITIKQGCLVGKDEIQAKDAVSSLRFHLDPQNKSVIKKYLEDFLDRSKGLDGFEFVNNFEFKIHLKAPYEPFISILALPGFAMFKENGKLGSGSGPMIIRSINLEKGIIELEKNPSYCGQRIKSNQLNIWDFNKIDFSKLGLKEHFDVFLGSGVIQKFPNINEQGFKITKSKSISFLHFFPNARRPYFKDEKFRKDFSTVFQSVLLNNKFNSSLQYIEKISTLMPKGVLLPNYYQRKLPTLNVAEFKNKWKSHLTKKLKVFITTSYFSLDNALLLESLLKESGINARVSLVSGPEIMKILQSRDYDLITQGYIGNYPDPDGLLDPFYFSGNFKYVNSDTTEFEEQIHKFKHLDEPKTRLSHYAETISKFEERNLVFPGYQLYIPFIHNKKILIPDTTYRYESEIWNIFWEK